MIEINKTLRLYYYPEKTDPKYIILKIVNSTFPQQTKKNCCPKRCRGEDLDRNATPYKTQVKPQWTLRRQFTAREHKRSLKYMKPR